MSSFRFNNTDFKQFAVQLIKEKKDQILCSKLRQLNKQHNSCFEEAVNCATLEYKNLQNLATSKFAQQIQNLKLRVPVELEYLNDLCFISTKYFDNIKSIKMRFIEFTSLNSDEQQIEFCKKLYITENLSIQGLTVENNEYVKCFQILGKHDVTISNSKFHGLLVWTIDNADIKFSNIKTYNSPYDGFKGTNCTNINIKNIQVKNCQSAGLYFDQCQNVLVSNNYVQKCRRQGCCFYSVPNFEVTNTKIFKCRPGICFFRSNGRIKNVVLRECKQYAVQLINSQVRYDGFLCVNNGGDDVGVDDDHWYDPSAFVQGV